MSKETHEAYEQAKTELAYAQRDKIRFKLAQDKGQYVLKADVEKAHAEEVVRVRTKLLAVPARLTPQVTGLTNPAQVYLLLSSVIEEVLNELALPEEQEEQEEQEEREEQDEQGEQDDTGAVPTAADPDSQRVG